MFPKVMRSFILAAVVLTGVSHALAQQADDAIVVGTVFDPTHAAVSGATVQLMHVSTNAVTEIRTDERGQYRTPSLRIGEYVLSVEAIFWHINLVVSPRQQCGLVRQLSWLLR